MSVSLLSSCLVAFSVNVSVDCHRDRVLDPWDPILDQGNKCWSELEVPLCRCLQNAEEWGNIGIWSSILVHGQWHWTIVLAGGSSVRSKKHRVHGVMEVALPHVLLQVMKCMQGCSPLFREPQPHFFYWAPLTVKGLRIMLGSQLSAYLQHGLKIQIFCNKNQLESPINNKTQKCKAVCTLMHCFSDNAEVNEIITTAISGQQLQVANFHLQWNLKRN